MKTLNSGPDQRELHLGFSQGHKETETLIGCCVCPSTSTRKGLYAHSAYVLPLLYHEGRYSPNSKVRIQYQPPFDNF